MGYLKTGLGFGLGYVLGARAGRQRYEELLQQAKQLSNHPKVQEASAKLPPAVQQGLAKVSQSAPSSAAAADPLGVADPGVPASPATDLPGGGPSTGLGAEPTIDLGPPVGVDPDAPLDLDPLVINGGDDLPRGTGRNLT